MVELSHNQEKKDKKEWAIINMFRSSYPYFPIGELEKSESPDFLLRSGDKLIGIELTELKYEREDKLFNLRAHEDFLTYMMEDAQRIVEEKCDYKLMVEVLFSDDISPTVLMVNEEARLLVRQGLAESIASVVSENIPEATGTKYKVDRTSKYGHQSLHPKIQCITILNVTGRWYEGLWYAAIATKVKPLSISSVSQRLVAKNCKLRKYNSSCDEQWLVIIQNSFLMSSSYNSSTAAEALAHHYKSNFDKVFVFERSEGLVTRLDIEKYEDKKKK
ncbi:MAG: hypothetical protein J5767_01460 [Paludibacteraceae bacterium]|nr:hypothetical protein [Paludibacteraceae bacterium]